jgi:hypothetical protein
VLLRRGAIGDDKSWKAGMVAAAAAEGTHVSPARKEVIVGAAETGVGGSGADTGTNEVSTSIIMSLVAGLTGRSSCFKPAS